MNAAPKSFPSVPLEVVDRARREREFFNRHSDPAEIPDDLLRIPLLLDCIPEEIGEHFASLRGKHICEFGCGYGVVSAYFALQGATVFGFDVSDANVIVARRAARVNNVADRTFFQIMQGECLAFPDSCFDLVFGNAVLHHLDIAAAAREIYRVLKPGGVAIFREPLGENRLLEWARNCSLRSGHRHTADEHSFLYKDVDTLREVFPKLVFRETEMFAVLRGLLRGEVGMIAILRFEWAMQRLARMDRWILSRLPFIRRFASYSVVTMRKPAPAELEMPATQPLVG